MCYIALVINDGVKDTAKEDIIKTALDAKADTNDDGFYLADSVAGIRTLDDKAIAEKITAADMRRMLCHFRIATAGKVSQDNVQGWTLGDWAFVHNGWVSGYTPSYGGKLQQDKSDSRLFFEDLFLLLNGANGKQKKIVRAIRELADRQKFYGRAILHNRATDKLYIFGDWEVYKLGGYTMFSSSVLHLDDTKSETEKGIKFEYYSSGEVGHGEIDGVYVLNDFSKPSWTLRRLADLDLPVSQPKAATPYYQNRAWADEEDDYQWYASGGTYQDAPPVADTKGQKQLEFNTAAKSEGSTLDAEILDYLIEQNGGAIGWNKDNVELFYDETGVHDVDNSCCTTGDCMKNLDYVPFEILDYLGIGYTERKHSKAQQLAF